MAIYRNKISQNNLTMNNTTEDLVTCTFTQETIEGLNQKPKKLYSKYFYDEQGDKIFQEIMQMEEYYLTRSEYEIFSLQKQAILKRLSQSKDRIQLVEFGAGDGFKTKVLLAYLLKEKIDFEYIPIDISPNVLHELSDSLAQKWPSLICKPIVGTYFDALKQLPSEKKKMVMFLGSNIGNFNEQEASSFLTEVSDNLNPGDYFLLGVDLKKDPALILDAYNDKKGITKAFNLNLLARINKELEANFQLDQFQHYPTYDPITGETKSYLISKKDQEVYIAKADEKITFKYAEPIFMEVSKKYSVEELESLALKSNFEIVEHFFDCKHYFINSLWTKK